MMSPKARRKLSRAMKRHWAVRKEQAESKARQERSARIEQEVRQQRLEVEAAKSLFNGNTNMQRYVPDDEVTAMTDLLRRLEGNESLAACLAARAHAVINEAKDSTTQPRASLSVE